MQSYIEEQTGTLKFANGDLYCGNYRNDHFHGQVRALRLHAACLLQGSKCQRLFDDIPGNADMTRNANERVT